MKVKVLKQNDYPISNFQKAVKYPKIAEEYAYKQIFLENSRCFFKINHFYWHFFHDVLTDFV